MYWILEIPNTTYSQVVPNSPPKAAPPRVLVAKITQQSTQHSTAERAVFVEDIPSVSQALAAPRVETAPKTTMAPTLSNGSNVSVAKSTTAYKAGPKSKTKGPNYVNGDPINTEQQTTALQKPNETSHVVEMAKKSSRLTQTSLPSNSTKSFKSSTPLAASKSFNISMASEAMKLSQPSKTAKSSEASKQSSNHNFHEISLCKQMNCHK